MNARIILCCILLPAGLAPAPAGPGAEAAPAEGDAKVQALFEKAAPAEDQDGKVLLTKRAVGHPVVWDFNADGRNDILLGCHKGMDTAAAEIVVLENVGEKGKPRFRWPARKAVRLAGQEQCFSVSCGCKSGGTFEVHPVDWNGDGHFDLVVNTYWQSDGVRVLLNTGASKTDPTFTRGPVLHRISSHGRRSGGGDWTGDGVVDFVFPVNHYGWSVYPGVGGPGGKLRFADKPVMTSREHKNLSGQRWFDYTPYAWNFSGTRPAGGNELEILAANDDPAGASRPYLEKLTHLEMFLLDRKARTVRRVGRLWSVPAAYARLSIGDLNQDGRMDVLCTGGVFTRGQDTKIWVLYGKVKNVPPAPAAPQAARADEAPRADEAGK